MRTHAIYLAELREELVKTKKEKEELIAEQVVMNEKINTLEQEKDLLNDKVDAIEVSLNPVEEPIK